MRRGIAVTVVAPGDDSHGTTEEDGVPVHRVRFLGPDPFARAVRNPLGWGRLARLWRALRSAARREVAAGAAVIHAHWWVPGGLAIPGQTPAVVTVTGPDAELLRHSRIARS